MRDGISACLLFVSVFVAGQDVLYPAPQQFAKFNNVENGWCASDATISLLLPDGNTLWLWGDCIIGEKESTFDVRNSTAKMINNAAIIEQKAGGLRAYYGGTMADPSSLIPKDGADIFWPEHATIEDDTIKVFAIRIIYQDNGTPGFNFRVGTTHLAYFTYPGMEYIRMREIADITDSTMRFGTHVFEEDGYTYIFGKKDTLVDGFKYPVPMLARVEHSVDEPWQFYAGNGHWSNNCREAVPVGDRPMSESYFVYKQNHRYYLIMHEIWLIGELFILEADSITGPWNRAASGGVENRFAVIPPHGRNFTYNLFAHPHFMQGERILISYNVNNSDFWPIFDDTRNYRARFYWLDVEAAVNTAIPDTLGYYDSVVGKDERVSVQDNRFPLLRSASGMLVVENVLEPFFLEVFGLDGRRILNRHLSGDEVMHLPAGGGEVLLIRLTGGKSTKVEKMINLN